MKKMLLLTSVLLALTVSVALAGGMNLNWGTVCYTEAPKSLQTFACTSNAGTWAMTSSFMIDAEMLDMVGVEITMEGVADGTPALVDWWKVGATPDCRAGKSVFASDFSTAPMVMCQDWTAGQSFNAYGYTWDNLGPYGRAHITAGAAISAATPFDMQPGVEYYAGKVTILNSKAVGAGACTGCYSPMIWYLALIMCAGLDGRRDDLVRPIAGGNVCLYWGIFGDPARNATWGQVKSLYR